MFIDSPTSYATLAITKRTLIKMMEEGTITSVSDNMQLANAMCHLMQTPRVKGLSAADLFFRS